MPVSFLSTTSALPSLDCGRVPCIHAEEVRCEQARPPPPPAPARTSTMTDLSSLGSAGQQGDLQVARQALVEPLLRGRSVPLWRARPCQRPRPAPACAASPIIPLTVFRMVAVQGHHPLDARRAPSPATWTPLVLRRDVGLAHLARRARRSAARGPRACPASLSIIECACCAKDRAPRRGPATPVNIIATAPVDVAESGTLAQRPRPRPPDGHPPLLTASSWSLTVTTPSRTSSSPRMRT